MIRLPILLISMLILAVSPVLAAAGKGKSPFISVFSCDEENLKNVEEEVCLIADLREGQTVYLLSDKVVCRAEAQEAVMLEREVGDGFMITPVEVGDCDDADYYLAYRGKEPKSFQPLEFTQEASAGIRAQVDIAVRNAHLTDAMINAFEGTLNAKPILYKPFAKRADIFLVQYISSQPLEEGDLYGPLFWYANGRVQLIDTQASIAAVFRLHGGQYILLRHGCWEGCGEVGEKVMAVSEKGIALIHHDTSFSD